MNKQNPAIAALAGMVIIQAYTMRFPIPIPFCTNLKGVRRPFQQDKHYIDKSSYYTE